MASRLRTKIRTWLERRDAARGERRKERLERHAAKKTISSPADSSEGGGRA